MQAKIAKVFGERPELEASPIVYPVDTCIKFIGISPAKVPKANQNNGIPAIGEPRLTTKLGIIGVYLKNII